MITEAQRIYHREWYLRNKERKLMLGSIWYRSVISDPLLARKFKDAKNAYQRNRYATDPHWKLRTQLKKQITAIIRRNSYTDEFCLTQYGCSKSALLGHIESLFKSGMSWSNYGKQGWCIDHKVPCCDFDLTNPDDRKRCFHYSNLQPLWYEENRKKSITHVAT